MVFQMWSTCTSTWRHSVNFVTAHDGFTLYDLTAYNEKHNLANGENNNDGVRLKAIE